MSQVRRKSLIGTGWRSGRQRAGGSQKADDSGLQGGKEDKQGDGSGSEGVINKWKERGNFDEDKGGKVRGVSRKEAE